MNNDANEDKHLDVCQIIEVGLKTEYEKNPGLTDLICINGLENAAIAIKQCYGYAKNQQVSTSEGVQGIVDWCLACGQERIDKVNALTLKEYVQLLDKIKRSVKRHSEFGRRGYYEFIKNYV